MNWGCWRKTIRNINSLNPIYELNRNEIKVYGGNYEFYKEQKEIEQNALSQDIQSKEKALRKAKEKERKTIERQNRLDSRGKKKQEKAGVARIMMNTLRNNAENSTSKKPEQAVQSWVPQPSRRNNNVRPTWPRGD